MPGKKRYPVIIFSFILIILLQGKTVCAQFQPYLDKKVSFTFSNTPVTNALKAVSAKTGVKFSYNPELIQGSRRVNMRVNNLPLRDLLKQLLNDPDISFREIGDQIVLYRGDPSQFPLEPNQRIIPGKPQIVLPTKKNPDTVYIYRLDTLIINRTDTIFRSVSITHFDTIRLTDTVFFEKNKPTQRAGNNVNPNFSKNSVKRRKFLENNGFYAGPYFEMLTGSASYKSSGSGGENYAALMSGAESKQLFKFSTGILAGYDYHFFGIRTGIGYTRMGEKFGYEYSLETGGFFKTDTVETYYTLTGIDTSWFYVTDSSWIPKDTKKYSYRNPNSFRYIDVPLSVKLRFYQSKAAEIYAIGGITASFLISADALHINPADKNDIVATGNKDLNPILLSWNAGLGTAVKFTPQTGFIAEATYRKQTKSLYKDLPLDKRYGLFGIKLSAYFKF